jgi:hypothetical protein
LELRILDAGAKREANFAILQNIQMTQQATEYAQLLNEALAISQSVRHELEPYLNLLKP